MAIKQKTGNEGDPDKPRQTPNGAAQVLVVGAGPTGLLLAGELARRGVSCRIIEQTAARPEGSRAITIQPRTLEVFEDLGVVQEALDAGQRTHAINYNTTTKIGGRAHHVAYIEYRYSSASPYLGLFNLHQGDTERILQKLAAERGVSVERPVRFAGLEQDRDGVTVQLEHLDPEHVEAGLDEAGRAIVKGRGHRDAPVVRVETASFDWVIGCDGLNSAVREALQVPFEGAEYVEQYTMIDAQIDWEFPRDESVVFESPKGTMMCQPMPDGIWRIFADLPPLPPGQSHPAATLERFQEICDERGAKGARVHDPVWMSDFRVHRKMVPDNRDKRVFLLGDSAHVHSPILAIGMNSCLQDAYNLGWKLALVVQGVGRPELLDSFEEERHDYAKKILRNTHYATRMSVTRSRLQHKIRDLIMVRAFGRKGSKPKRGELLLIRWASQLLVNYRKSRIVAEDWKPPGGRLIPRRRSKRGPAPGDRAPYVEFGPPGDRKRSFDYYVTEKHVLLLFTGETPSADVYGQLTRIAQAVEANLDDYVAVHVVVPRDRVPQELPWQESVLLDPKGELHAAFRAKGDCLYLIRPDMYVGYRARPIDGERFAAYLKHIFVALGKDDRKAVRAAETVAS